MLWRLIGLVAYNRITVINRKQIPESGPVLYVASHRNGALDAAAYKVAVKKAVPMISAQLQRSVVGRLIFKGIPVARDKDRQRGMQSDNTQAIFSCLEVLRNGGQLFVMPEGTSSLGHAHLPYRRGAARIAQAALQAGVKLTIIPLGVHYEAPTNWQSRVEVLVGKAMQPSAEMDLASLHDLITEGLESISANFENAQAQRNAELLAYAATLGTRLSYALSLKHFEKRDSKTTALQMQRLDDLVQHRKLCKHQGLPLIPVGSWQKYALCWFMLMPFVVGFCLLNAPVLAISYIASRKLPDAPNVIAFWRMTAAVPLGLLWAILISFVSIIYASPLMLVIYWVTTITGLRAWYRFRKLSVALCNALLHAPTKSLLLKMYQELKQDMSNG